MESDRKRVPRLRQLTNLERATSRKANESWQMFTIMAEFIDAAERLSEIRPAVSIFGSARIKPTDPYYEITVDIARRLSDEGFSVISGGGPGIMEAANKGAYEGSSPSIGLNIELPHEQTSNTWQNISLSFRHFFARKVAFVKYADAYIVLPGGFGTMDELYEILTWNQLSIHNKAIFILNSGGFYDHLIAHNECMQQNGFLYNDLSEIIKIIKEPKELEGYLR